MEIQYSHVSGNMGLIIFKSGITGSVLIISSVENHTFDQEHLNLRPLIRHGAETPLSPRKFHNLEGEGVKDAHFNCVLQLVKIISYKKTETKLHHTSLKNK